jgi:cell division protein FtsB
MRRTRFSHAKEAYYILCFFAALFIFLFAVFGPGGYLELKDTRMQLEQERVHLEQMQQNVADQMRTIDELKNDPVVLEQYLRQKGYARPGELIQELPAPSGTPK